MKVITDLLIVSVLLALLAWCATLASGAPAPVPRPPVPLERAVLGHWRMTWGSLSGPAVVSPQGFWGCSLGDSRYHGSWEMEGSVLTIREHRVEDPPAQAITYRIALAEPVRGKPGVAGKIEGGQAFSLAP